MSKSAGNSQSAAGTIATIASGLFAGAALGISAIDQPRFFELDPTGVTAADSFAAMYKRAAPLQGGLAVVSGAAALMAAAKGGHCSKVLWGASGVAILSVWPWTVFAMLPTNKTLIAATAPAEERGALAKKWAKLHLVRTMTSLAAFVTMSVALARLKH